MAPRLEDYPSDESRANELSQQPGEPVEREGLPAVGSGFKVEPWMVVAVAVMAGICVVLVAVLLAVQQGWYDDLGKEVVNTLL